MAEQRIEESRAFFGPRAATWDSRFPDDGPAYARAVDDLAPGQGARVLDLGCGTGRAVEALRRVVGARGSVAGVDVTPEMVDTARRAGRDRQGVFVVGDGGRLPFARGRSAQVSGAAGRCRRIGLPGWFPVGRERTSEGSGYGEAAGLRPCCASTPALA